MAEGRQVRNVSAMMHEASLCTKDPKSGHPCCVRLRPGEISRVLSEDEFRSAELTKLLGMKVFVDVTGYEERQRQAREALGRTGR